MVKGNSRPLEVTRGARPRSDIAIPRLASQGFSIALHAR
jgi:hypothetical protein